MNPAIWGAVILGLILAALLLRIGSPMQWGYRISAKGESQEAKQRQSGQIDAKETVQI